MDDFREGVRKSFQACKNDIESLRDDVLRLSADKRALEEEVLSMREDMSRILKILEELRAEKKEAKIINEEEVLTNIKPVSKPSKDSYEALLAYKAKANKRDLLKQKLMSMLGDSGMPLAELKFMFVEHFRYCSKATFYNYLKELELERLIRIEREKSRNMVLPLSLRREI